MNQNNPSIVHPIPSDSIRYHQPSLSLWDSNLQGHLWLQHGPGESRITTWSCYTSKRRFHNQTTKTYDQKLCQMICFTPCTAKTFIYSCWIQSNELISIYYTSILYFPDFFLMASSSPRHAPGFLPVAIANLRPLRFAPRVPNPRLKRCPRPRRRWDFLGIPQKLVKFTTGKTYDWLY